ncbi:hypothetical protein ACFSKM_15525 [Ancylobacter dichloromethanicus]
MGEADHLFQNQLMLVDRGRDIPHHHVRRKELADEVVGVELADALAADAPRHRRHAVEVRLVRHRRHGGL